MYRDFYGFSAEPFALSPDPKFLYLAHSHFEAFSSMMSGIKERKGIIVITGEVGVGKTILIYALLKDLSEKIRTAFVFQTRLDFKDLLKNILMDLDVPITEKEENLLSLLLQFKKYLNERLTQDETVTIVIDEAHSLDDEVLKELGRLSSQDTPSAKLLQILLVGQPELEVKLNSKKLGPLKEKIAVHRQISPLTREEGSGYVAHRLKVAGRDISEVFTPEAVNQVWEFAEGIPRVMNLLCDRALLIGFTNSTPMIDSKIVGQAIQDFHYLRSRKSRTSRPVYSWVKSHYKIFGIILLFFLSLGVFSFFFQDFRSFPWKLTGKILSPEKRPAEKPREEIRKAKKRTVPPEKQLSAKGKEEVIEVKEGWNLSLMARQYYPIVNASLLDFILEANPQITNMNLIFPSQRIKIPNITEESLLIRVSGNIYNIHLGTFQHAPDVRLYKTEPSLSGKKLTVVPRKVSPRETWYRIVVGDFNTKEEAIRSIQILKQKRLLPLLDCLSRR